MDNSPQYFSVAERQSLLRIARDTIEQGLETHRPARLELSACPAKLAIVGASFVTLKKGGTLRGCIGSLTWERPLAADVSCNAYAAAFHDPRFSALRAEEYPEIELSLSVLSPTTPITFADEPSLLKQLRPNVDGLVIHCGNRQATFLPSVWESLQDPEDFLAHLKNKAGLASHETVQRAERYTVAEIS